MSPKINSPHENCPRCGQSLAGYPCYNCNGKGYVRELLFFKNTCSFCNGSGILFRCPDEMKHILEDYKQKSHSAKEKIPIIRSTFNRESTTPLRNSKSVSELSRPANNLKFVNNRPLERHSIPPWDIRYPFHWHPNHPLHDATLPPWDINYKYGHWHPNHPLNPNRLNKWMK